VIGTQGRRRKQLLDDLKGKRGYWKLKKESTRSHSVENSFWERLWTHRKTDCILMTCPYCDGIHPLVLTINRWQFVWTVKVSNSLYSTMLNRATCFGLYDHRQAQMYIN
jgi:hypothetical protein